MKIGILGGTFDPIHNGHTFIGREVARLFLLDRVLFMVARTPPHKQREPVSSAFHRHAMAVLGTLDEPLFQVSLWELRQDRPSYTIRTLEEFRRCFPHDDFCFIAGSDALSDIKLWAEYRRLLTEHTLVFVRRAGNEVDLEGLALEEELVKRIQPLLGNAPLLRPGNSFLVSLPTPSVSSTMIREIVARRGRLPRELLARKVYYYIQKYRLYEADQKNPERSLRGD